MKNKSLCEKLNENYCPAEIDIDMMLKFIDNVKKRFYFIDK